MQVPASDGGAADVQLARHPDRHGSATGVQHVRADVVDRPADWDDGAAVGPFEWMERGVDAGLRRPIQVDQLGRDDGVRAVALCPGFVDTPMAEWSGIPGDEMIQPEDCAEVVRMLLRLSPHARIPQVVIERAGSVRGDVPVRGA